MKSLFEFFIYMLIAAFLQNSVFTRTLGVNSFILTGSLRGMFRFGYLLTASATCSTALGYGVNRLFRHFEWNLQIQPLCFLLCISLTYVVMVYVVRHFKLDRIAGLRSMMVYACFNCTVLAIMLLSVAQNYSFMMALGFGFGTGVGYLFASLLVYSGRRRLRTMDVPKAFAGLPITFIYLGIISLSLYGLIGHRLLF